MNSSYLYIFGGLVLLLAACNPNDDTADAYGNFEAVETTVSA